MIFGAVPLGRAGGAILAHSMQGASGRVQKGTLLEDAHLADLAAQGHETLVVARLEEGDVEENAAATVLAAALVPEPETQGLRIAPAGAGRVNLYATGPGVVALDVAAITALNAVDPMITLATVAPFHRVEDTTMVATIKIISYGVSRTHLAQACASAPGAIAVHAPRHATATLIETQVGALAPGGKGRAALAGRLDRLGLELGPRVIVAHAQAPLGAAIAQATGDVVFILTASATSDMDDVAPAALRAAGGTVTVFGVPVDPGNLLFFGRHAGRPVIGLPGCARSPALNGADWVLERLICGVELGQGDISAMGVGGLLKEIPTRPRPRAT